MYDTIDEIIEACSDYYFSESTMAFFNSEVYPDVYHTTDGRTLFITSERQEATMPKLYTIREAQPDGRVNTVSKFQEYGSLEDAQHMALGLT